MSDKAMRSSRERNLLALFPAAALLALYVTLYAIPKRSTLDARAAELTSVSATAVDPAVAEAARKNMEYARNALVRLKTRLTDEQKQIGLLCQSWRSDESRLEAVKEITELARKHDLSILSQEFAEKPALSAYFEEVVQVIEARNPAVPLEYWHVELEGGWMGMAAFFTNVDLKRLNIIPLSFSLDASDLNDGRHKWKIVFAA